MSDSVGSSNFNLVPLTAGTRVMSPRTTFDANIHQVALLDIEKICNVCGQMCAGHGPVICARCGKHGHPACIRVQMISAPDGLLPFCHECYPIATDEFRRFHDQLQRNRWADNMRLSLYTWKGRVQEAIGAGTAAGTSVGGAITTAAAGAVGFTRGFVQSVAEGVSTAAESATESRAALPPVPEQIPPEITADENPETNRMVRSNSDGVLSSLPVRLALNQLTGCNACDFKKHERHKFELPGCRGLPRSVYGLPDSGADQRGRSRAVSPSLPSPRSLGPSTLPSQRDLPQASITILHEQRTSQLEVIRPQGTQPGMPPLELADAESLTQATGQPVTPQAIGGQPPGSFGSAQSEIDRTEVSPPSRGREVMSSLMSGTGETHRAEQADTVSHNSVERVLTELTERIDTLYQMMENVEIAVGSLEGTKEIFETRLSELEYHALQVQESSTAVHHDLTPRGVVPPDGSDTQGINTGVPQRNQSGQGDPQQSDVRMPCMSLDLRRVVET